MNTEIEKYEIFLIILEIDWTLKIATFEYSKGWKIKEKEALFYLQNAKYSLQIKVDFWDF